MYMHNFKENCGHPDPMQGFAKISLQLVKCCQFANKEDTT